MGKACEILQKLGINPTLITSGSTPTYFEACKSNVINKLHLGNYVFMDNIQKSLDCGVTEKMCVLTILATVISAPRDGEFVIDAGSKCLGLDTGAHGNNNIKDYGLVKDHKELRILLPSKLVVEGRTNIKIGDKIEIIPNHSCSAANTTSYYISTRNDIVDKIIKVDMRSNSTPKKKSGGD